jgi:hypothetical protein
MAFSGCIEPLPTSRQRTHIGADQARESVPDTIDSAEHKTGAGSARGRDGIGSIAGHREGELELLNFEEQHRKRHREAEPMAAWRNDTARRFSLITKLSASKPNMPTMD